MDPEHDRRLVTDESATPPIQYDIEVRALDTDAKPIEVDPDFSGLATLDELPGLLRDILAERAELVGVARTGCLAVGILLPEQED